MFFLSHQDDSCIFAVMGEKESKRKCKEMKLYFLFYFWGLVSGVVAWLIYCFHQSKTQETSQHPGFKAVSKLVYHHKAQALEFIKK